MLITLQHHTLTVPLSEHVEDQSLADIKFIITLLQRFLEFLSSVALSSSDIPLKITSSSYICCTELPQRIIYTFFLKMISREEANNFIKDSWIHTSHHYFLATRACHCYGLWFLVGFLKSRFFFVADFPTEEVIKMCFIWKSRTEKSLFPY